MGGYTWLYMVIGWLCLVIAGIPGFEWLLLVIPGYGWFYLIVIHGYWWLYLVIGGYT